MNHPTGDALNDTAGKPLPCPFCYSTDVELGDASYVLCNDCLAFGPNASDPDKAIAFWNRCIRPEPAAVRDVNRECAEFDRCVQSLANDICPRCNGFKKVAVRSPDLQRDNPFFDRVVSVPCPDCAATGWRKP